MRDSLVAVVGIKLLVLIAWLSWLAFDKPDWECEPGTVTVQAGDTPWSIITERCTGHIGKAVHAHDFPRVIHPWEQYEIRSGK